MSTEVINTDIKTKFLNLYKENSDIIKNGSPDFINQIRDKAIKLFEEIGIPDKKNENYKYTDLKKEFENGYKTYLSPKNIKFEINDIFSCDVPDLNTKVILLLNGWYYDRENLLQELPGGAIIGSFQKASEKYPDLVKRHFARYADCEKDGLVALNTAFVKDGILCYPRIVFLLGEAVLQECNLQGICLFTLLDGEPLHLFSKLFLCLLSSGCCKICKPFSLHCFLRIEV